MESSQLYAATLTHYSTQPLTTGQFALLKFSVSIRVDEGLSSDLYRLYLGHGQVSKYLPKLHNDQREKCLRQ